MLGTAQELGMLGIVSKSGVVFSRLEDGGLTSLSGDVGPDWIGNLLGCFLKDEKKNVPKLKKVLIWYTVWTFQGFSVT